MRVVRAGAKKNPKKKTNKIQKKMFWFSLLMMVVSASEGCEGGGRTGPGWHVAASGRRRQWALGETPAWPPAPTAPGIVGL